MGTFDTDDFPEIEAFVKKILAPFKDVCVENADGDLVYAAFGFHEDFFEGGTSYFSYFFISNNSIKFNF